MKKTCGTCKDEYPKTKEYFFIRKIYKDSLVTGQSVFDFKDKKAINEIVGLRDEIVS